MLEDSNGNHRTLYEIIWTCLVTMFTSTWVVLHPSVPHSAIGHHMSSPTRWDKFRWRVISTLGIAIAPGFMVVRATAERWLARKIVNEYNRFRDEVEPPNPSTTVNKSRWTLTHGFFLLMNGFMLHNKQGEPIGSLTPEIFFQAMKTKELAHWPLLTISKGEIEDKSKGDFFTKSVVAIHATWFIVSRISRSFVGLPLVELEVMALAFALMNVVILALWWDKPQDVNLPIPVAITNPDMVVQLPPLAEPTESHRFSINPAKNESSRYEIFFQTIQLSFTTITNTYIIPVHMPCSTLSFRFAVMFVATIFAGFHFCSWSTNFPSIVEGFLWRSSSIVYLVIPLTSWLPLKFLPGASLYSILQFWRDPRKTGNFRQVVMHRLFLFPLYVFARVILFTVAFSSLRSLPDSAFLDVQWSRYIPHFQ